MDTLLKDFGYAWRMLRKNPGKRFWPHESTVGKHLWYSRLAIKRVNASAPVPRNQVRNDPVNPHCRK